MRRKMSDETNSPVTLCWIPLYIYSIVIWIANAYPIVSFFIFQRTKIFVPHIKKTILYKILMISIPLEIILDWTTIVLFAEWGYAGESSVYVSSNKVNGVNQLLNSINCTAMSLVMLYESTRASGGISNRLRAMIKQNSELLAFIFSEWLFVFGGACFMWSMQDSWPTFIIKNNAFCVRSSLLFIFNQKMVKQFIDKSKKLQRGVSETGGSIVGSSNATTGQGTSKTSSHL